MLYRSGSKLVRLWRRTFCFLLQDTFGSHRSFPDIVTSALYVMYFVNCSWVRLKKSNKMQLYADIYLLLNYTTCFGRPSRPSSWVYKTVVAASSTDHTMWGASHYLVTFGEACSTDSMICTQRLQLQFYVLLMMGAMDARNMYSNLAVNKYLHTVASCWIPAT